MITQRISAGDWVYYPTADTKPHLVEVSEHDLLYIQITHYRVYFNTAGKISETHNAPSVFIATPASQNQLSKFYCTEFRVPSKPCTVPETLDLLFDEQKYVLLQVEADPEPYVYAVSRAKYHSPIIESSTLGYMNVPGTGSMYPIDEHGERIIKYKPVW